MSDCKVSLDADLAAAFARALESTLRRAGYERVFEFSGPEGPTVVQFRRGQSVVAIDQHWEGEEHRLVSVDSEDVDCQELVRQAAIACAADIVADLFAPLSKRQRPELRAKAEAVVAELTAQLL